MDLRKGDKPSLIISTLEALAVLISLKLFFGDEPKQVKDEGSGGPDVDR